MLAFSLSGRQFVGLNPYISSAHGIPDSNHMRWKFGFIFQVTVSQVTKISYEEALRQLPKGMRNGIEWFNTRKGLEIDWPHPSPVANFPYLVTPAKAIYKPAAHMNPKDVAFSIRQNLDSTYGDIEPILRTDGSWVYQYHQEGDSPDAYVNRSLLRNIVTHSPIAVLIQTKKKPRSKYLVLGIAVVVTYKKDFFYLEGFNVQGVANLDVHKTLQLVKLKKDPKVKFFSGKDQNELKTSDADLFLLPDFSNEDHKVKLMHSLLNQYNSKCVITGTEVPATLEILYLCPSLPSRKQNMLNTLLVRADIRNLFESKMLSINPRTRKVVIGKELRRTDYSSLDRTPIEDPKDINFCPSEDAIEQHFNTFSISEAQKQSVKFRGGSKSVEYNKIMSPKSTNYIRISLTARVRGEERVPSRSGLNWGQRPGRNPNQAYLPITAEVHRSGFFPTPGTSFSLESDDGVIFECVRAQQDGKAIETPANNALIGKYFRERLGVESGESVAIWHLTDYGRTSIEIFKIAENRYFLDFSRPN